MEKGGYVGIIQNIYQNIPVSQLFMQVIQITENKLILSDTLNWIHATIASDQVNQNGSISNNCFIHIKDYSVQKDGQNCLWNLYSVEVICSFPHMVGDPQEWLNIDDMQIEPAKKEASTFSKPVLIPRENFSRLDGLCSNSYPVIRVRVVGRSPIRSWSNGARSGLMCGVDLVDETGQRSAVMFDKSAEKFWPMLEVNKIYIIGNFCFQQRYSSLIFEAAPTKGKPTQIQLSMNQSRPEIPFNQETKLASMHHIATSTYNRQWVDVKGIVHKTKRRTEQNQVIIDVDLVSADEFSCIRVSLSEADVCWNSDEHPTIILRHFVVHKLDGRPKLIASSISYIEICAQTSLWNFQNISTMHIENISSPKLYTIAEMPVESIRKSPLFKVQGTLIQFGNQDRISYRACPNECCRFCKVSWNGQGCLCHRCGQIPQIEFFRYTFSFAIKDHTGKKWITAFDEIGCALFGVTATELESLQNRSVCV